MTPIELLTTRRSVKKLGLPAPSAAHIENMLQAATQVPDHGQLTPWRFVVITGQAAQTRLEQTLLQAAQTTGMGEEGETRARQISHMAPLIVGVIAAPCLQANRPKPEWEQHLSAGCAAYAIQLAAKAQGFDSIWITGPWVSSSPLRKAFGCAAGDKIIALLAIGTAAQPQSEPKNTDLSAFTQRW